MAADLSNLLRSAARLKARNGRKSERKTLPALLFLTDPGRIADPVAALKRLPSRLDGRLGVVFRHFGAKNRLETALNLKRLCAQRHWVLLIGADPALAARIQADGVHLPERMAARAQSLKRRRPAWIVTTAAHDRKAIRRAGKPNAFLLSPAFPSQSASAQGKNDMLGSDCQPLLNRFDASPVRIRCPSKPMDASSPASGYGIFVRSITRTKNANAVSATTSQISRRTDFNAVMRARQVLRVGNTMNAITSASNAPSHA